ncbi:epoxide hydrolase [Moniliophthora roreri MCA 2997]|uniref:Epoxide hydrolase n=1 Tax=Moniliophthora roreri (strain MCA 2997) TaxID=1381753 RepID=V2XAK1_MONRO|nr:epoxide hydrolase [Moniliophthora roreri MCA 2997]
MDPSSYRSVQTSRVMKYQYYFAPPRQDGGKWLLLLNGFPGSSFDWHHQVTYFEKRGYGLIVPDMLGYGGSSKPTDVEAYRHSLIANDLKDILDAEGIQRAVVIGHDWGTLATARLLAYYPERVQAMGLLTVGYLAPPPPGVKIDMDACNEASKKAFGYEVLGYWEFFSAPDAPEVIMSHLDTFLDMAFAADPEIWKTDIAPTGAVRACLTSGKTYEQATWLTPQERARITETLRKGGFEAPTNYYKVHTSGLQSKDDEQIPPERRVLPNIPVFFGDALKDHIAREELFLGALGIPESPLKGENVTRKDFDACHWLMMEKPDEVSQALHEWVESF